MPIRDKKSVNASDPRRYLDSEKIPFIVFENFIRRRARGVVLGCRALVTNLETKQSVWAIVGDLGPLYKIGEISIAARDGHWGPFECPDRRR